MENSISPDQVRATIEKFWQIMCGKSTNQLEELYSSAGVLFTGKAKMPESASVALARRRRQIIEAGTETIVEIGAMEIQVEEPGVAIVTYTYRFHYTRPGASTDMQTRRSLYGRATQILERDHRGVLQIVHEHLSAAATPDLEKTAAPEHVSTGVIKPALA